MSVSLKRMNNNERARAITRRLRMGRKDSNTGKMIGGLGYWGAVAADIKARTKGTK